MIQVIEFEDAYPDYKYGFLEGLSNPKTATEKLLGNKSCLTIGSNKNNRTYQHWFLDENVMDMLLDLFPKPNTPQTFHTNIKDGRQVHFLGIRRDDTICGLCLDTHERVMFSTGFEVVIEK